MPDDPLSEGDVEDVLAGRQPADRADHAVVAEWIAHLREASRAQPVPPINPYLQAQIDRHPVPALLPLTNRDDVSRDAGARAVTAINARSPAVAPEATHRDPRLRRTAVSLAAAVMLLLGAVTGVRLAAGQADEPDVRSRPATEPSIERNVPAGDPYGPDDADRSQEGGPKEPPPPAEPEPSPEPAEDPVGGSQPEPHSRDPLVTGDWGDLADEWLERYCESQMPPHPGGQPRRGRSGPHSSRDIAVTVCETDASGTSPHDRDR